MIKPEIPKNENLRLQALKNFHILDTPIQENFERITRIAQIVFNVPIVSFTLIDANRQWFKSIQGFDICETSRDVSFCAHAINQDDLFIVEDALLDSRFADNPLVIGDPKIRFYAGYPIKTKEGFKIGTLCLIDFKPRTLTPVEKHELKDMAGFIEAELLSKESLSIQKTLNGESEQAKQQTLVDGLTRLWNRSGIEKLIREQISKANKNKENFGLALIDIDNFKMVNDKYGHNIGDCVLRAVAKRLLMSYRSRDIVGRWKGEEFLVIMNDKNSAAEGLFNVADKARSIISEKPIILNNLEITLTITTGVSLFKWDEPCGVIHLINDAEKALYEGKHNGKNVVKIFLDVKDKSLTDDNKLHGVS